MWNKFLPALSHPHLRKFPRTHKILRRVSYSAQIFIGVDPAIRVPLNLRDVVGSIYSK